jgi:hypothetical protein
MVLKHNGKYGYIESAGSIDNPITSQAVLDILEGGSCVLHFNSAVIPKRECNDS